MVLYLLIMGILQVCKLQEQLETTMQKLEESKQLLKTNENGRFIQFHFPLCKNDTVIELLLKINGSNYNALPVGFFFFFVKSYDYCHLWKISFCL